MKSYKTYKPENLLQLLIVILTYIMIVARFLLNEKGRTNPDSMRYLRQAHIFPYIDNTTTPLGYPLGIKFFTYFGLDEFWSSKILGLVIYTVMLWFCYQKKFYFKELLMTSALFSFVSVYSYTMTEVMTFPFVIGLLYYSKKVIDGELSVKNSIIWLAFSLILIYNVRYSALFIMAALGWYGLLNIKKPFGKSFLISAVIGVAFMVFYQLSFINYFNETYVDDFLNIGVKTTPQLLVEFFQGMATSFNPFVHIANPSGGIINYGIYGIGMLNLLFLSYLLIKNKLNTLESLFLWIGIIGILCSYFVQYFYSVNPLDYRLIAPFTLSLWLLYFSLAYRKFGVITYAIPVLSLCTGFAFTWLSKGNYLENRAQMSTFLTAQHLDKNDVYFYIISEDDYANVRTAELISTINPKVRLTFQANDTLRANVLTPYKIEKEIEIKRNQFQKFDKK